MADSSTGTFTKAKQISVVLLIKIWDIARDIA